MTESKRPRVVHEAPSPFGTVYVVDEGDQRSLHFGSPHGTLQSAVLRSDPLAVPTSYVRVCAAGLAFTRGRGRVMVVGLGGGAFPLLLHRRLPKVRVDVVELNPVVVDVAERFFGVHTDTRLRIHVEDGAAYMRRREPPYDLILLDAFSDEGTPDHLKEARFLEDVRSRLANDGVAVLNIALETRAGVQARIDTFAKTFKGCALLRGPPDSNNRILVGLPHPAPSEPIFRARLWQLSRELALPSLNHSVVSFARVEG